MSKTFRYTKFTKYHYCDFSDEWEEDGVDFDYEVEDDKLLPKIVDLLFEEYFSDSKDESFTKEHLTRLIEEKDLVGWLADYYEETLKEIYREEAMEFYED